MMSEETEGTTCVLAGEHLIMGATLGEVPGCEAAPLDYPDYPDEDDEDGEARLAECAVCDLSGLLVAHITGADAPAFVDAAFALPPAEVGECVASAVLMGDGSLASVAFCARTGDEEYAAFDLGPRQEALGEWLLWLSRAEGEGGRAFPDCKVEDATDVFVPLLLAGESAGSVLADYLDEGGELPEAGRIASLELDGRHCLVSRLREGSGEAYGVLAPPHFARILWRSIMSFRVAEPLGRLALDSLMLESVPWWKLACAESHETCTLDQLVELGIARADGGYVGFRGLADGSS